MDIRVSMPRKMYKNFFQDVYDEFTKDGKQSKRLVSRGLSSKSDVIDYINTHWGLLGHVTDIVVED